MNALTYFLQNIAVTNCPDAGTSATAPAGCETNLPEISASPATFHTVLQLVFGVLGVVSVILIIYAGMTLITGQADSQKIKDARNTIIWALIGLAIALSAEAAVYLFLGRLQ